MVDATPEDRTQPTQFAVTNVTELLERSAYYGFTSIFSLYLLDLGYKGGAVGAIAVILLAFPYVIPLLTAPLAEKLGYKPVMLVALLLYSSGFVVLSTSTSIGTILAGTVLVASGAGGFKPVATATVAHVTAQRHRSLGYTIYYTGINIGGFAGPFLVAKLTHGHHAAFLLAAGIMAAAFLLVLLLFRSPQPPQPISIGKALAKLGAIFEDMRLLLLLVIFSGFWFLYSINFSFLAPYLDRFVDLPGWFEPSLQQSYNPLIVILFAIPIGALTSKKDPRRMMTLGVLLYVVGFCVVAFWQSVYAFFIGLFIATCGEIAAYPAFLSYLATIAPKDRVAVYQSYGFLPLFIGFFFGPIVNGKVYQTLAVDAGRPELFWAVPISVGIFALAAFLATAQPPQPATGEAPRKRGLAAALLVLLLIPLLFGAAALAGKQGTRDAGATAGLASVDLPNVQGSTNEGQTTDTPFDVPLDARGNLTFRLTWSDEPPQAGATNRPDTFRVAVVGPANADLGKVEGASGDLVLVVPAAGHQLDHVTIKVSLLTAGDQVIAAPVFGDQVVAADNANSWTLRIAKQVEPADS